MLAKTKPVDYFYVSEEHAAIHQRLQEWARWVRVRPIGWGVQPMFRQYRSHAWQWHTPTLTVPVDTNMAVETEKLVAGLPEKHRTAIRWGYVFRGNPLGMSRHLSVSKEGLLDLLLDGRTMLKNRLASVKKM